MGHTTSDVLALFEKPFFDLIREAHETHRANHKLNYIQKSALLSIKTGGCSEDCAYCPQSAHYETDLTKQGLMGLEDVRKAAREAKEQGADRFCMGAAWRSVPKGPQFEAVLEMIKTVKQEGLETCVTLGMLDPEQAARMKEAGLDFYNHNLDTGREYYDKIITTRTYDDRLDTLRSIKNAGLSVCSGGIVGMGETTRDRASLLAELAGLDPHPQSVPINALIAVEGTPLANTKPVDPLDLVRTIAVARLLMPRAVVRLSAGRASLSREAQTLCFFAGANSVFLGEKLLTRDNAEPAFDERLFNDLGLYADSK